MSGMNGDPRPPSGSTSPRSGFEAGRQSGSRRNRRFLSGLLPTLCLLSVLLFEGCSRPAVDVEVERSEAPRDAATVVAQPGDWPWWRGPANDNTALLDPISDENKQNAPPIEWGPDQNLFWKSDVPGEGHATPILHGSRLFVASADAEQQKMWLLAYHFETGEPLWQTQLHAGGFMHTHHKNSHASSTPACDGERVYATFMVDDGIWVSAVDLDGNQVWQKQAGPFRSKHGYGSSPLLFKSLLIVAGDNEGSSFLAALDRETGELAWRVSRDRSASFATPAVADVEGQPVLIMTGHRKVDAYDPHDGKQLWSAEGPAATTANTPACSRELAFVSGGYPERKMMAVHLDGSGRVAWSQGYKAYVPSPLFTGSRLYFVQDNGVVRCLKPDTGDAIWTKRLGGNFSASPVRAGDRIYLPNESGTVYVFRDADTFELLAKNELDGGGFATPVIARGRVILRTRRSLYALGRTPQETAAP